MIYGLSIQYDKKCADLYRITVDFTTPATKWKTLINIPSQMPLIQLYTNFWNRLFQYCVDIIGVYYPKLNKLYLTTTNSYMSNIPSSLVPAVSHSPDILDQFYLESCHGQELLQPETETLAETIPTSQSYQTVNPSYLDRSLTGTTQISSPVTKSSRDQLRLALFPSTSKTGSQGVLPYQKVTITSPPSDLYLIRKRRHHLEGSRVPMQINSFSPGGMYDLRPRHC